MQGFLERLPSLFGGSVAFIAVVATYFWGADELLGKAGKEQIAATLTGDRVADRPRLLAELGALLDRQLPWRTDLPAYLLNVLLLSALAMVAVGILYFARTGGFVLQLTSGGANTRNFLAQLLFDGLLKVWLVNAIGLLPHRAYIARLGRSGMVTGLGFLVMDVALREVLLIAVSALVWTSFALLGGSFGCDPRLALQALVPTFAGALRFENLTAIYVYGVAATSLPLFVAVLVRIMTATPRSAAALRGLLFWLPWQEKPVRSLTVVAAALMVVFGLLGSALLGPFVPAGSAPQPVERCAPA